MCFVELYSFLRSVWRNVDYWFEKKNYIRYSSSLSNTSMIHILIDVVRNCNGKNGHASTTCSCQLLKVKLIFKNLFRLLNWLLSGLPTNSVPNKPFHITKITTSNVLIINDYWSSLAWCHVRKRYFKYQKQSNKRVRWAYEKKAFLTHA